MLQLSTKNELRSEVRARKKLFSNEQLEALSLSVMSAVEQIPQVGKASTIMLYSSLPDEVGTRDLLRRLHAAGKRIVLPAVVSDTEMELRVYDGDQSLREGRYGIMEPCGMEFAKYSEIDVAIVPGMAFDRQGNRLGRGKGYYDRFLHKLKAMRALASPDQDATEAPIYIIGVCFPFQLYGQIPVDSNDVGMDLVVSCPSDENARTGAGNL